MGMNKILHALSGKEIHFIKDSLKGYNGIILNHEYFDIVKTIKDMETGDEITIVLGAIEPFGVKVA